MQNFVRYYEFTFFDVDASNNVTDIKGTRIFNSINFSFNYNIILGVFNTAKFYFYNISETTINLFASKKNRRGFYFRACYDKESYLTQSLIFRGLTFRVNTYREGPDIITEITACDAFYNLQQPSYTSPYYPSGTPVTTMIQDVSNYLGVFNSISGSTFLTKSSYNHPIKFNNTSIVEVLNFLTSDSTCTWSSDVSGVKISPLPNNPDYESGVIRSIQIISKNTGLVGNVKAEAISVQLFPIDYFSEQRLKNNHPFVTATCLLRPMPIFSKIRLECEIKELNGVYTVYAVAYQGEYRGNPWFTTMKLTPVASK